jgi:hypothetical protein
MKAILSQRLRQAAEQHRAGGSGTHLTLSLQDLLRLHGESSLAVLLMLLAVVSVLPVAGAGTVMSLGIWVVAWSWVRERETLSLPQRLGKLALNERWSGRCLHGLAWLYESSQRCMRPRWAWLSHAGTRAWWGAWIGLMGFVIFVPLPFGNVLPSLSLVLLSLGWMFRDGLALVLSTLTGLAGVAYGLSMAHLAVKALSLMFEMDPLRWLNIGP